MTVELEAIQALADLGLTGASMAACVVLWRRLIAVEAEHDREIAAIHEAHGKAQERLGARLDAVVDRVFAALEAQARGQGGPQGAGSGPLPDGRGDG